MWNPIARHWGSLSVWSETWDRALSWCCPNKSRCRCNSRLHDNLGSDDCYDLFLNGVSTLSFLLLPHVRDMRSQFHRCNMNYKILILILITSHSSGEYFSNAKTCYKIFCSNSKHLILVPNNTLSCHIFQELCQ